MQEVDDLLQGFLGLVLTGHVLEGDAGGFFHVHLGVGFAHAADAAEAAAGLAEDPHHQHEQAHHNDDGQHVVGHEGQHRAQLRLIVAGVRHIVFFQQGQQLTVGQLLGEQRQLGLLGLGVALGLRGAALLHLLGVGIAVHRCDVNGAVLEQDLLDLILLHHVHHFAVLDLVAGGLVSGVAGVGADVVHRHRQHHGPQHQRQDAPHAVVVFVVIVPVVAVIVVICHGTLLKEISGYHKV